MKTLQTLPICAAFMLSVSAGCQEDYVREIEERPTEAIDFKEITASRDSACMFDTIVLIAHAEGNDLKYTWQRAKGSLSPVKDEPNKVYFWGCSTCTGDLTVSCTVENEFGSYTKEISVFVYPWYSWQEPWPREKFELWLKYINGKK